MKMASIFDPEPIFAPFSTLGPFIINPNSSYQIFLIVIIQYYHSFHIDETFHIIDGFTNHITSLACYAIFN